jgi:hypothetical protein
MMKSRPHLSTLLALMGLMWLSAPALARDFTSSFGYRATVPDHWRIFTRDDVKNRSGSLDIASDPEMKKFNPQTVSNVQRNIASGNVEVFFNLSTSNSEFADNINVMRSRGRVPVSEEEGRQACDEARTSLPSVIGRPITLHDCGYLKISGHDALYLNMTVSGAPYRTAQYMLKTGSGNNLLFTLTATHNNYPGLKREFDAIVGSVRAR